MARVTHYLPYFCRENGPKRQAACNAWILPREHDSEPSCPDCAAYVLQEAADDHLTPEDIFGKPEAQS